MATWLRRLFIGLVFALAAASASAQQEQSGDYTLGSGDRLRVTVFGQEDMSGEFSVTGAGDISLPFVGKVKAGGLTVTQLETKIVNLLQPDYLKNPRVSVEVLNYRPFDIIGEVRRPGSYPYRNGMTILNAVAMAGGFTYRAKEEEFLIQRATNPTGGKERAGPNTVVLPGDLIEVQERFF
ncbi:MAG: polysaccharide biosynthesis/export family protein [Alphaproteobacteria bacterium]|nr:polysaccharide biosynthesis/export family protein [Alphaproteobacteria bacterium]